MNLPTVEYWNTLKQHKQRVLHIIGICCVVSLLSYFILPKKYKVSTTIALQTQYFQVPLVSGFLPETLDSQELRAKREALIRRALNQKFLAEIAHRYKLIKDPDKEPSNSHELELLAKKFEIIPNGPSAFIINFSADDPDVAYQVVQDLLNRLRAVMTTDRRTMLINLHDAIQDQLDSLSSTRQGETANAIYSVRPDLVQQRIERIQMEIDTLKASYSEKHPRVTALKDQLAKLSQWSKPLESSNNTPRGDLFNGIKVDEASKELFDDLLKKYRYLEVVIYMDQQSKDNYLSFLTEPYVPHSPTWPKLPILLAWGVTAGFLIGSVRVLYKELPRTKAESLSIVRTVPTARIDEKA